VRGTDGAEVTAAVGSTRPARRGSAAGRRGARSREDGAVLAAFTAAAGLRAMPAGFVDVARFAREAGFADGPLAAAVRRVAGALRALDEGFVACRPPTFEERGIGVFLLLLLRLVRAIREV
jgi:hypothetical protein